MNHQPVWWISALAALFVCLPASHADETVVLTEESEQTNFSVVLVTDDLDFAWDMEFLPGGDLLLSEYDGRLRLLPSGKPGGQRVIEALAGVPGTIGLRGIKAHPDFRRNGLLYLCHAFGTDADNRTRIVRGRFDGTELGDIETLFQADNASKDLLHYGCRLNWLPDGTLIATMGDRYHHLDQAQRLQNHYGVAIRINADGSVPDDNPFIGGEGVRPEIWAFGIRNTQGAAFHPQTGELWSSDHGPYGGDEINVLRPGRNYGWPRATYGIDYDMSVITDTPLRPEAEPPLYYWYPSIAPSSVAFYSGSEFPRWQGDLFVTTLARKRLLRLELHGDRIVRVEELLGELDARLRDVTMGPDGRLYLLTDTGDSRLLRVGPM